jgi:hypothetical protein
MSARMPAAASATPSEPASSESTILSVINWRAIRAPLAPRAVRSATSGSRAVARASRRFTTLAQATSETSVTAPKRTQIATRAVRVTASCNGTTRATLPACTAKPSISDCACTRVTPGFTRAMTLHRGLSSM